MTLIPGIPRLRSRDDVARRTNPPVVTSQEPRFGFGRARARAGAYDVAPGAADAVFFPADGTGGTSAAKKNEGRISFPIAILTPVPRPLSLHQNLL